MSFAFQDWRTNKGNIKSQIVLCFFRICHLLRGIAFSVVDFLCSPILILYRVSIEWIMGIEIPCKTKIGRNLNLHHGQALVVNDNTVIGENCVLRNSTTIGNKQLRTGGYSAEPNHW